LIALPLVGLTLLLLRIWHRSIAPDRIIIRIVIITAGAYVFIAGRLGGRLPMPVLPVARPAAIVGALGLPLNAGYVALGALAAVAAVLGLLWLCGRRRQEEPSTEVKLARLRANAPEGSPQTPPEVWRLPPVSVATDDRKIEESRIGDTVPIEPPSQPALGGPDSFTPERRRRPGPTITYSAYCVGNSYRAVCVRLENVQMDSGWPEYWIPRSVIQPGSEIEVTADSGRLILPVWFIRQKGLPAPIEWSRWC
jgi:hypothetical protein